MRHSQNVGLIFLLTTFLVLFPTFGQASLKKFFSSLNSKHAHRKGHFFSSWRRTKSHPGIPMCNMLQYEELAILSAKNETEVRLYRPLTTGSSDFSDYVIWKQCSVHSSRYEDIQLEMNVLAKLNRTKTAPRILCRYNTGFMMERIRGIPMANEYGMPVKLKMDDFKSIVSQMAAVVTTLHHNGIAHLDLQLSKWILDVRNMTVRLIHFSRARPLNERSNKKKIPVQGNAPEIRSESIHYSAKTDVYLLGRNWMSLYRHLEDSKKEDLSAFLSMLGKMQMESISDRPSLDKINMFLLHMNFIPGVNYI